MKCLNCGGPLSDEPLDEDDYYSCPRCDHLVGEPVYDYEDDEDDEE